MKRWSIFLPLFTLVFGAAALAQQPASALFSSDLVLWSYMQEPQAPEQGQQHQQPTPDPHPDTQPAQNPTPSQPGQTQPDNSGAAGSQDAPTTAQTFTGIIDKDADSFVLKVSEGASYKLDSRQEAEQYEGKRVRVTGTQDSSMNLIHVEKIEPMS